MNVDAALKEVTAWYAQNRRAMSERDLGTIVAKHTDNDQEAAQLIHFLASDVGRRWLTVHLKQRKDEMQAQATWAELHIESGSGWEWGAEPAAAVPNEPFEFFNAHGDFDKAEAALFENDDRPPRYYIRKADGALVSNPANDSSLFDSSDMAKIQFAMQRREPRIDVDFVDRLKTELTKELREPFGGLLAAGRFPKRDEAITKLGKVTVVEVRGNGDLTVRSAGKVYVVTTDGQTSEQTASYLKEKATARIIDAASRAGSSAVSALPLGPLLGASIQRSGEVMKERIAQRKGVPWQMATFGPLGSFLVPRKSYLREHSQIPQYILARIPNYERIFPGLEEEFFERYYEQYGALPPIRDDNRAYLAKHFGEVQAKMARDAQRQDYWNEPRKSFLKERRPDWAEEFEGIGGRFNPDGTVTLYHATTKDKAERIIQEGVLRRPSDAPDYYGVYLSSSPSVAEDYGDGTLVRIRVKATDLHPDDVFPGRRMDFNVPTTGGIYRPAAIEGYGPAQSKQSKQAIPQGILEQGQELALQLGNGVRCDGPFMKNEQVIGFFMTDVAVTGTTFFCKDLEGCKERLIVKRKQFSAQLPEFLILSADEINLLSLSPAQIVDMDLSAKYHWARTLGYKGDFDLLTKRDVPIIESYILDARKDALLRLSGKRYLKERRSYLVEDPETCELVAPEYWELLPLLNSVPMSYSLLVEPEAKGRKIDEILQRLKEGVESISSSANFREFLITMSKFHNYSIGNQILIMLQRRNATRVAGFTTWKDLGRYVKAGEKGIAILAPCMPSKRKPAEGEEEEAEEQELQPRPMFFKVVYVFDISQTEGKPLAEVEVPSLTGEANEDLFAKVLAHDKGQGVNVSFDSKPDQNPEIKGYYVGKSIWVRPEESRAQQLKTLIHETAHYYTEGVFMIPRADAETIAESVAFTVGAHYGFDSGSRSFPYVAVWAKDKKVLDRNLLSIRKIAGRIIEALEK